MSNIETPANIKTGRFTDSIFQNTECETILRNIVLLQQDANPHKWTPFTWEEYKEFCTHNVTLSEKGVIDAFVKGGRPVPRTSARLNEGWLEYSNGRYSLSTKMKEMLARDFRISE